MGPIELDVMHVNDVRFALLLLCTLYRPTSILIVSRLSVPVRVCHDLP